MTSPIKDRGLIGSAHLDTLTGEGIWYQRYSSGATPDKAYPVKSAGQLEVRALPDAVDELSQVYWPTSPGRGVWRRVSTGGVWGEWSSVANSAAPGASAGEAALRRTIRVNAARKRLLGGAGIGGQAAVALRFDDGHDAARDKVLPLLRKYGIPGFWAVSERYLKESSVTGAQLRSWAHHDGVEVTAHSRTHADSMGETAIRDNIFTWGNDLETLVGGVVVDTWTFPGGGDFGGLAAGAYPSSFSDTYAGRLLMERYAAPYGATAGWLQPLTGEPTIGQSHVTIETYTLAQVQDIVAKAQRTGMGVVLMLHPTKLDTAGHMSTATFDSVLAWLASERQADRLVALTGTGLAFAHSGAHRANLLPALPEWTAPGWTVEPAHSHTVGITPVSASVEVNAWAGLRGAPMELVVPVFSENETVVRVAITAAGGAVNITKDTTISGKSRIYQPLTIPTTALGSRIDVSVSRVSGSTLSVNQPELRTI